MLLTAQTGPRKEHAPRGLKSEKWFTERFKEELAAPIRSLAPETTMAEFMNGKTITFRYFLWPEGSGETTFSPTGAGRAIEAAVE